MGKADAPAVKAGRARSSCLIPRLEAAAERGKSALFLDADERVSWAELHDDARAMAAALHARGVGPGERAAVLGPTSRALVTAIRAVWLSGAAVMVLPLRTRLTSEEEFWHQTRDRIELADPLLTVAAPELTAGLEGLEHATFDELAGERAPDAYTRPPDDPDAVAIVQFTSGSTADPKGVMIPHRCVADNVDGIGDRVPMGEDDAVVCSWLPIYHDMGLVMMLANVMTNGAGFVVSTPQHFIAAPGSWMGSMSVHRGTWTIGPNFAFSIATRMLARSGKLDLSSVRGLGNGSEPISPEAMWGFRDAAAADHGLDPAAMYGAYGMAEATVVISIPPAGSGFAVDTVDGDVLENERAAAPVAPDHPRARPLARVGAPIRGMDTRIVDTDSDQPVEERRLGEIEVRGPSVVPGYFRRPDATEAAFHDGWLRTGDLGYLVDGELVICGRLKDVIVVGGRNVFPQDLERAAEMVEGVRPGNIIAFGTEGARGREEVVVVAEVKVDEHDRVRRDVARSVGEAVGLRPSDVVLLSPGTLPKTSSGKLRRSLCRARYLQDQLEAL